MSHPSAILSATEVLKKKLHLHHLYFTISAELSQHTLITATAEVCVYLRDLTRTAAGTNAARGAAVTCWCSVS